MIARISLRTECGAQLKRQLKKLWQQVYVNVGLNVLGTKDPDDYGWSALSGVTGAFGAHITGKFSSSVYKSPIEKYTTQFGSNYAGEYFGDSERLRTFYNSLENQYDRKNKK